MKYFYVFVAASNAYVVALSIISGTTTPILALNVAFMVGAGLAAVVLR